jgi:uncharacterized protein YaaR (DUF327 family)
MQFYYNLNPPEYEGESDLVTLEVPAEMMDVLFTYSKEISNVKNIQQNKIVKEIIKESIKIILNKNYDRKNRKAKKR